MRIARLDLVRYGRFSDYAIDFGSAPAGGPDFHVVYGLNEAGKSTAAAAILDLLFGIEKQSSYGGADGREGAQNWHAYSTMRIGAQLEFGGAAYTLARIKRDKMSLVDADNRPFDESLIKGELGGIDRASFRTMFSLDDESLEKGGEAILASRGDLGQLLFSASAGLAEFGARLESLREEADGFFRARAKSTVLAEKKRDLERLREERDRADTLASSYAELVRQRDDKKAAYEAAARALGECRARADYIRRVLAGLPHLAALRAAEAQIAPLASLPTPPAAWEQELQRLQTEAVRLAVRQETAQATIRTLEDEAEQIGEDAAALAVATRVEAWRDLRSRYDSAKDIPARQAERDSKWALVADILRRLGREGEAEPIELVLSARAVGALEDLIASRSGVEQKLAGAREAHETARAALDAALDEAPRSDSAAAIETLKSRLQSARREDPDSRREDLREELEKRGRKIVSTVAALAPWTGAPEALALISVPTEAETAHLRERLSRAKALRQQLNERLEARAGEAERLKAEAAAGAADLVGEEAAAAIRAAREAAWSTHRAALDDRSADAFEAVMRRDDAAAAARLATARELAAARERAMTLAGIEAERARAQAELDRADEAMRALEGEIAALAPASPPAGRDPLSFLDTWRARRGEALALIAEHREMKEAMRRLEAEASRQRRALGEALRAASAPHDPEAPLRLLMEAADAAIAEAAKGEVARQRGKERRVDLSRAEAKLKAAVEEEARWRSAWRQACASSWLGEGEGEPPLGAVRQALKALEELRAALKDCADLEHRIAAMERDRLRFASEVEGVATALGFAADEDAARLADAVASRVAEARENARRRAEKTKALEKAGRERAEIAEALAVNRGLGSTMTRFFGVDALSEVAGKLESCKRRDALREAIDGETRAILAANIAPSFEAARAALEGADPAALEQELNELSARQADDDRTHAESFAALTDVVRRLDEVGGDDAVARIEEKRRTILEEITDGARRYLALRAGVAAADEALKLYRDRHRGAMMERASRAFCEISRGAYRGLTTQPSGQMETLIALGADGGSKSAEQLSKGARFQLYLALRVAGYHELAKSRPPAPFVADDIMETFDHFRAEEALKLFADMSRIGQVIYFTHHLHLAEIAKKVCPKARVHELAA